MAHMVFCVRNKKEMEGLDEPPFDSEFGQKIFKNVSKQAWGEWVDRQKMLLNEYRLQPWTPSAQQFLVEQMEARARGFLRSLSRRRTEISRAMHLKLCCPANKDQSKRMLRLARDSFICTLSANGLGLLSYAGGLA